MENADVVNEIVAAEPVQQEEQPEPQAKPEAKKRGRKPKAIKEVVEAPVAEPVIEDVKEVEPVAEEPVIVKEAKPKAKRASRTSKKTVIEVVPIDDTLNESQVQVEVKEEAQREEPRELTLQEQQAIAENFYKQQLVNKKVAKQTKYKRLLSSAF